MDLISLSASAIADAVKAGKASCLEVAETFAARVEATHKNLNTHIFWDEKSVFVQAERQQGRLKSEKSEMPLAGVPVVIKDNMCTVNMPTTCGSNILKGFTPPYSATVVERLIQAGAVIFGKANMDEFAMGSSNENSAFGPVKNPWDLSRVPGGSSGGSAAAVAGGLAPVALGSDTGGSIRQPASFCGLIGLKPTYGAVSRYGLVAFASSLDQIGPLSRSAKDAALIFDSIAGHDPLDSTSTMIENFTTSDDLEGFTVKGLKIGVIKELFAEGLDSEVRLLLEAAISHLEKAGAKIQWLSLPNLKYSISTYYIIATAEASSNLARYDGVVFGHRTEEKIKSLTEMYQRSRSEGFGAEVKRRIMLGTYVLSSGYYDAYYGQAEKVRGFIATDFAEAFGQVDLLLSPTAPSTAFEIGEKISDPLAMYLSDICTLAVNLAGLPAISVPCGFDSKGLPAGMQMIGPKYSEKQLLGGAHWYEQSTSWHHKHPSF